ncbi:MAG TPA: hypothetical protein VHO50_07675 [Bacteroidales bacterium]|nr:hypothetical protein [Bacteroidales bacterium]
MKNTVKLPSLLLLLLISVILIPVQSCEPDDDDDDNCESCEVVVYKPNIYLYPVYKSQLEINLSFPMGGSIVTSIPAYGIGWKVNVDPSGKIDDKYDYLFYESKQPDIWQVTEGWTISQSDLETFFTENMLEYGFNEKEIKDFTDYWIPRLEDFDYYEIYPQESYIIEKVIKLDISQKPDNELRLFYLIKGATSNSNDSIKIPAMNSRFNRRGFNVTEWGVVLK